MSRHLPVWEPREHQDRMLRFHNSLADSLGCSRSASWATPGSGKTSVGLELIRQWRAQGAGKVLVLAPPTVAVDTWQREASRWRQFADLRPRQITPEDLDLVPGVTIENIETGEEIDKRHDEVDAWDRDQEAAGVVRIRKGKLVLRDRKATKQRIRAIDAPVQVVSYSVLEHLTRALGSTRVYDAMIPDEATFLKSVKATKTIRSWRFRSARHIAWNVGLDQLIEFTGSPQPNGPEDLFGQIYLLDRGQRMGRTLKEWRERWCVPDTMNGKTGQVFRWKIRPGEEDRFNKTIAELALRVHRDIGTPLVEVDHYVKLSPLARQVYQDLKDEWVHTFEDGVDVLAGSSGVLVNKMLQVARGAVYDQDRVVRELCDARIEAIVEFMETVDSPALMGYSYKPDWARLSKRLPKAVEARQRGAIEAFRQGRVPLLGAHPDSMSHGIDGLQGAGHHVLWFGGTYNLEHYQQLNARLHRDGQKAGTVYVHRFIAEDTIEELLFDEVLPGKSSAQDALTKAAKHG